jgi:hypothetical protein
VTYSVSLARQGSKSKDGKCWTDAGSISATSLFALGTNGTSEGQRARVPVFILEHFPWDMDAYRKRKMRPLRKSLGLKPAGFHGFRHFNVSLLDALRVPLKTIQERPGHALTGSFTLDVYGGKPEWEPNLDAARLVGAEIERAVKAHEEENKAASHDYSGSLTAIHENGSGVCSS